MCKVSNVLGMAINDKPHSFLVDSILFGLIIITVRTILKVTMIQIKEQKEKKYHCAIVLSFCTHYGSMDWTDSIQIHAKMSQIYFLTNL